MLRALIVGLSLGVLTSAGIAEAAPAEQCFSAYEGAQSSRRASRLVRAKSELAVCVETCPSTLRTDCERWKREVDAEIPRLAVDVRGPNGAFVAGVEITVDGAPASPLEHDVDPGEHLVRATAPGHRAVERRVTLSTSGPHRESFVLEPSSSAPPVSSAAAPPPAPAPTGASSRSVGPFVLGGGGAAALIVGGIFSLVGWIDVGAMRDTCAPAAGGRGCDPDRIDRVETGWVIGGVLAGVGALALAGAVGWRVLDGRPAPSQAAR